jgi:hypothetical protein
MQSRREVGSKLQSSMNAPNRAEPELIEKENKMNDSMRKNRNIDALGWGALFIWWGVTLLIQFPAGVGLIGVGLILLASNAARYFQGIRMSGFTTTIGVLALIWGALELAGTVLPFALPLFPILLIVLGLMILFGSRREDSSAGKVS